MMRFNIMRLVKSNTARIYFEILTNINDEFSFFYTQHL